MNTTRILLTSAILLAACDTATIGDCTITPVGAQGISEDMDMDGVPDHRPFMVATFSPGCTAKSLAKMPVALYEQGPPHLMHGSGTMAMLGDACAVWTWNTTAIAGAWGIAVTPVGGTVAGVYSPDAGGMSEGAALPVWREGAGWTARLPAGIPAGCVY
jgi:hypothetical protein